MCLPLCLLSASALQSAVRRQSWYLLFSTFGTGTAVRCSPPVLVSPLSPTFSTGTAASCSSPIQAIKSLSTFSTFYYSCFSSIPDPRKYRRCCHSLSFRRSFGSSPNSFARTQWPPCTEEGRLNTKLSQDAAQRNILHQTAFIMISTTSKPCSATSSSTVCAYSVWRCDANRSTPPPVTRRVGSAAMLISTRVRYVIELRHSRS
jgi:hypothetical protein